MRNFLFKRERVVEKIMRNFLFKRDKRGNLWKDFERFTRPNKDAKTKERKRKRE